MDIWGRHSTLETVNWVERRASAISEAGLCLSGSSNSKEVWRAATECTGESSSSQGGKRGLDHRESYRLDKENLPVEGFELQKGIITFIFQQGPTIALLRLNYRKASEDT